MLLFTMVDLCYHCHCQLLIFFLQGQHFSALSSQEPFSGGLLSWKWVAPPQYSSRSSSFSVLFEVLLCLKVVSEVAEAPTGIWHGALAKQAPSLPLHINFAQPSSDAFLQDAFAFPYLHFFRYPLPSPTVWAAMVVKFFSTVHHAV